MNIPFYHGGSSNKKAWSSSGGSPFPVSSSFYLTIPFYNVNTFYGEWFVPVLNGLLPGNEIGTLLNYPGRQVYYCGGSLMAAETYCPETEDPQVFYFKIVGYDYQWTKGIRRDSPFVAGLWDFTILDQFEIGIQNEGIKYYVEFSGLDVTPFLISENQFHLVIELASALHWPTEAYIKGLSGYLNFNIVTPL